MRLHWSPLALTALLCALPIGASLARAASVADTVSGKILLQVEGKGEAWYVHPITKRRWSLGRPDDAYQVMRSQGVGITNADLAKIPVGVSDAMTGADTDGDGLTDALEDAIGTNKDAVDTDGDSYVDAAEVRGGYLPTGMGKMPIDSSFASGQKGKIFLQVQGRGQGWWVNPADGKRYFLGRAADAFAVMRSFGLGVSNKDLGTIPDQASTAASKTPDTAILVGADCGTVTDTSKNEAVVISCMEQHFKNCTPATVKSDLASEKSITAYSVVGKEGEKCVVTRTEMKHPDPAYQGKSMRCPTSVATFEEALTMMSLGFTDCKGTLRDALEKFIAPTANAPQADSLAFTKVTSGIYVGPLLPNNAVIASSDELEVFWNTLYPDETTRPAVPTTDFVAQDLISVFGDRGTYSVELKGLTANSISLATKNQSDNCAVSYSQPFEIVAVAKASVGDIVGNFSVGQSTQLCRPATPDVGSDAYVDPTYGFKVRLPDAVKYFTIKAVKPAEGDFPYDRVDFSRQSMVEDKIVTVFSIYRIPLAQWPDVEKSGSIAVSTSTSFKSRSVKRVASDDGSIYVASSGDSDRPSDVPEYDYTDIETVQE